MSDDEWSWIYNLNAEETVAGLPPEVIAEVERLADQLVVLGEAAGDVGRGRVSGGGMRIRDIFGGRGFFGFFVVEHLRLIAILRVSRFD